jgi:ferredoxin
MNNKLLAKDKLDDFLAFLKKSHQVYAPVDKGGKCQWSLVDKAEEVCWEFTNTEMSPKEFFFPQTECMMRFKNKKDDPEGMIMKPEPLLDEERVLLNIRPCDAKAFALLDKIFMQDDYTNDTYWRDKREKTVLVGLACNDPCSTCFCSFVNCGPHHEEGLDLLLVDLGQSYLVRVLSEKGGALVEDLADADKAEEEAAEAARVKAGEMITNGVQTDHIAEKEVLDLFNDAMWDKVYESCLNCGTCTFVCPTCHCFDIQDEVKGTEGRRVRNWDYCMSWLFTVHGTGHNPRPSKKERVRQRFMHKFKYIPMKRDGEIGCVGCGRCVQLCPVNIDVREVVNQMNA